MIFFLMLSKAKLCSSWNCYLGSRYFLNCTSTHILGQSVWLRPNNWDSDRLLVFGHVTDQTYLQVWIQMSNFLIIYKLIHFLILFLQIAYFLIYSVYQEFRQALLDLVVWFQAWANFHYCPNCPKKYNSLQKWSKVTFS